MSLDIGTLILYNRGIDQNTRRKEGATMTRFEKRQQRLMAYKLDPDNSYNAYHRDLGYVSRYFSQVGYTNRQRLAVHLRNKAQRANPGDTALLPWQ